MKVSAFFWTVSIVVTINVQTSKPGSGHRAPPLAHKQEQEVERTLGSEPTQTSGTLTQDLEDEVEWFVVQLKLYVHEEGIDAADFESRIGEFDAQFAEIAGNADISRPKDLVSFDLPNAIRYLKFFDAQNTAQRIVRSLVQLNVWLLALHDSHGNPDPQKDDYVTQIAICSRAAFLWADSFYQVPRVPYSVSLMFEEQYHRAKYTLRVMEGHLEEPYALSWV
ncbi:hypothetical protein HF325_005203 [Metschnikowia pulcherrima]|uniref:Uncharacterized protein n=1 Tax=Metschnikowia pulcherrima TaxID=27326 RepID=A0A8H7GPT0_9ASCO|nr:hypothetical protein HF325_005203 [Metschnikowia pulcherrima]